MPPRTALLGNAHQEKTGLEFLPEVFLSTEVFSKMWLVSFLTRMSLAVSEPAIAGGICSLARSWSPIPLGLATFGVLAPSCCLRVGPPFGPP